MRRRRAALSPKERAAAAKAVARRAITAFPFPRGARVGLYLSTANELSTEPLIELALRRGWRVYVPVLHGREAQSMWFQALAGPLRRNRYGIAEPVANPARRIPARWLDLAFVPVVAFDSDGNRIGSGAGFYDRTFAYLRHRRGWHKPLLVGLAYSLQHAGSIEPCPWDVPLAAVVTERGVHRRGH